MICPYNILVYETHRAARTVAALALSERWATASLAMAVTSAEPKCQESLARYWANDLGCKVRMLPVGEAFDILCEDDEETVGSYRQACVKTSDGNVGWINWSDAILPEMKNLEKVEKVKNKTNEHSF